MHARPIHGNTHKLGSLKTKIIAESILTIPSTVVHSPYALNYSWIPQIKTHPESSIHLIEKLKKKTHIPRARGLSLYGEKACSLLETPPLRSASKHDVFNLAHVRAI